MYFEALPVAVGDAFLITDGEFQALVDGGEESDIVGFIRAKKITDNHFNIMVCTHYDTDHVNGLLDLLKNKYVFDQIWLPEPFGSLAKTVVNALKELNLFYEGRPETAKSDLTAVLPDYVTRAFHEDDDDSTETIDVNLLESIPISYPSWHPFLAWPLRLPPKMSLALGKICSLTASSIRSGAQIRWFRDRSKECRQELGFGFSALNCEQVHVSVYTPPIFDHVLSLTAANKHSLVFQFQKEGHPAVLFTADSDLAFAEKPIALPDYSVVTAPHHGSKDNDKAYGKITGKDRIFVRSDRSQTARPGKEFLRQPRRYCTICRNKGPKQNIQIELNSGGSNVLSGRPCRC